jgi:cytochrome c biogenesis protein
MGESFFHSASLHDTVELTVDPEAASELVRRVVHHHHYRVIPGRDSDGTLTVYADRWRWGPCGTVVAHLSFVVILLGFTASSLFGFKNSEFAVPVGTQVAVGNGTQLSVEATRFIDTYTADGSPLDYASDLVLYDGGREVGRQTVRVNQPMRYGGVSFYQSFFGVAASMKVTDARGAVVYSGGVPLTWQSDDGTHSIGQLPLPTQGLTVFVVGPASGQVDPDIKAGQMQIEVYRSGSDTPASVKVLDQGTPSTVEGLSYTFERTRRFTGLIVSRDPGAALVWLGSAMLVLGIVLVFFFPHRRVWVRITPVGAGSQVRVASILRRDLAFETQFQSIVHDVRLAGSPTSPAGK